MPVQDRRNVIILHFWLSRSVGPPAGRRSAARTTAPMERGANHAPQRASLRLAERSRADPYWAAMPAALAHTAEPEVHLRPARLGDVDALANLEERAFRGDRISRRGFRRFVRSPRAALLVAEEDGVLAG